MDELNSFQRDCLVVVAGLEAPNGMAVKETLDQYYAGEVFTARLYPALDSLAEAGLVEKRQRDGRTNLYRLTPEGRRVLSDRRRWEDRFIDPLVELPA